MLGVQWSSHTQSQTVARTMESNNKEWSRVLCQNGWSGLIFEETTCEQLNEEAAVQRSGSGRELQAEGCEIRRSRDRTSLTAEQKAQRGWRAEVDGVAAEMEVGRARPSR